MEFELDRMRISGYETLMDTTLLREETLEMIVPDACPDILRIVETDGKVLLARKEAMDGRVELGGSFQLSVLYLPDGENGLRHLDVTLPFSCTAERAGIGPGCTVAAAMRLCRADTKAINPRKVLVRAEAAIDMTVFSPREETVSAQVLEAEEQKVEQLTETQTVYLTACVQEKPFPFSEELSLSAGKPAAVELLKSRVCLSCGESKIIGNKLIFKGSVFVMALYRGEDDGVYAASDQLPFSQIMEVTGVTEEAECDLRLALTGAECTLDPENDGRTLTVHAELLAQAVVRELQTIVVLADAYSTRQYLTAEWELCPADDRLDRGSRTQNARQAVEAPGTVREVMDCRMAVGQVTRAREGERLVLSAQAELQILCLGETGELFSLRQPVNVPCALELPEGCVCLCQCESAGEVYATPSAAGVEVRFTLDFHYCAMAQRQIAAVRELRAAEAPADAGAQPSLVLRMLEQGERLWDVAKAYGTTIADIVSANELEDVSAAEGRLLLIPRKR